MHSVVNLNIFSLLRNRNFRWTSVLWHWNFVSGWNRLQSCWWLHDGNSFMMLVTESLCWWLYSSCSWLFQCKKPVTKISKLSSIGTVANIRHQHRCSRLNAYHEEMQNKISKTALCEFFEYGKRYMVKTGMYEVGKGSWKSSFQVLVYKFKIV